MTLLIILGLFSFGTVHKANLPNAKVGEQQNSAAETLKLKMVVVSDIHVQSWDKVSQEKYRALLDDISYRFTYPADALVINGDLGNGKNADYETLRRITFAENRANRPPVYFCIGNHEYYKAYYSAEAIWYPAAFPNGETEEAATQRFLGLTGMPKVYYDVYINGYHLIFLGSEKSAMSNRSFGDSAYLSPEQLDWLERKLNENLNTHTPIFVFLHQPLCTDSKNPDEHSNGMVIQREELRSILKKFPEVVFFSGHIHHQLGTGATMVQDGFTMFNSSSVYEPLSPSGASLSTRCEGLVVEVYENKLVVRGRDFLASTWLENVQFTLSLNQN